MRKIASMLVIVLFSIGLISCEAESTAEDQILYEVGTDDDDTPVAEREGTDDDDTHPAVTLVRNTYTAAAHPGCLPGLPAPSESECNA